ncbi:hypothetical protein [Staphylococcus coagulans]|uniref:hypothetical protein n=1 Tax=Staphylococcus coagulans TaxID=74706 RepID=UPI001BEB47BA|nr:hypothetical protein [Staphylococcus coagulans]MBT2818506.1 hypothetical protein [Staphylococcus coagulans]
MRVRKNMYKMNFGSYIGVLVDESLMKKLAKIQYETKEKILELLENNPVSYSEYSWTISEEPKEFSQEDRISNYIYDEIFETSLDFKLKNMFNIKKVNNLYKVTGNSYPELREQAEAEHTEHLRNMLKENS